MTYIRSHPEAVKVLSIMHYPAYNGPINTALLIQPVIEKDNIDILTLIPSGSDNLEQFFEHRRVPYRSEKLSRLRTTLNPLVQIRLMGSFISDIQRLRRLIKEIYKRSKVTLFLSLKDSPIKLPKPGDHE